MNSIVIFHSYATVYQRVHSWNVSMQPLPLTPGLRTNDTGDGNKRHGRWDRPFSQRKVVQLQGSWGTCRPFRKELWSFEYGFMDQNGGSPKPVVSILKTDTLQSKCKNGRIHGAAMLTNATIHSCQCSFGAGESSWSWLPHIMELQRHFIVWTQVYCILETSHQAGGCSYRIWDS